MENLNKQKNKRGLLNKFLIVLVIILLITNIFTIVIAYFLFSQEFKEELNIWKTNYEMAKSDCKEKEKEEEVKNIDVNDGKKYEDVFEELVDRFSTIDSNSEIKKVTNYIWWIDEDDYNILIPDSKAVIIAKKGDHQRVGELSRIIERYFFDELDTAKKIMIRDGFTLDEKNSSKDVCDGEFYDYVQAYKKGEERCIITVNPDASNRFCSSMCYDFSFSCSSEFLKHQKEQIPFLDALSLKGAEKIVHIGPNENGFYRINVSGRRAGYYAILKEEGDTYKSLFQGQDAVDCDIVEKEGIPQSVISGKCWDSNINSVRE